MNDVCNFCSKGAEPDESFGLCPHCASAMCAACKVNHVEFCAAMELRAKEFAQPSIAERKARRDANHQHVALPADLSHPKASKPDVADVPAAGETVRVLRGGVLQDERIEGKQ